MAKVILAHGDPLVRVSLKIELREAGHDVFLTTSGREALEQVLDRGLPSLVILDLTLADFSGFFVAAALRKKWSDEELPILVLTSHTAFERAAFLCGATSYLAERHNLDAVMAHIHWLIAA